MSGIVWTGQVNFTDSSDVATTGVATLTLTPDVGVSNLPALVTGPAGPPPTLRNVTVNQVDAGVALPASSFTSTGTAGQYDLVLYVNKGATGATGTTTISAAADVQGSPTSGYTLAYSNALAKWVVSPALAGDIYSATTYSTVSASVAAQATLATITVPAQPFDWRPDVEGYATATGGASSKVELGCYLNDAYTGNQVGYGPGVTGNASICTLQRAFGAAIGTGSYGKILAGTQATLYLVAKQVNTLSSGETWSVQGSSVNFSAKVNPVPSVYNRPITVSISGAPTGGTYTLTYGGQTTSAIAYNATASTVQTALQALTSIGSGNATVTGYLSGVASSSGTSLAPFTVILSSSLASSQSAITATSSLTGGTSPGVVIS